MGEGAGLPRSPVPGLVPTLNNMGWMTESLDAVSQAFAAWAGTRAARALDLGCAYGIATQAALRQGARVTACDLEPRHLEILATRTPAAWRPRLQLLAGRLPEIEFAAAAFDAILAARVLHFLNGDDIRKTLAKCSDWLRPGGRLFLVADTPYVGPWKSQAPAYERRKAAGETWPGYIDDYVRFLPKGSDPDRHPRFINPLDPDILARECTMAGLAVHEARFLRGGTPRSSERDHAGVIAEKPVVEA